MKDLFLTPELLPANLQAVLEKYANADESYETCRAMLIECEAIGYTFDYYLNAEPYALRPINVPVEDVEYD